MNEKHAAEKLMESQSSFARRLGLSKSTVCKAVAIGRLVLTDGKLDVADNLRRWNSSKTGTRPDVLARHAAGRKNPTEDSEDQTEQQSGTVAEYTQQLLAAQNALARLAIDLRTHRIYPLAAIEREAQALGSTLRGALERLVDQTAPRLAVCSDDAQRAAVLEGEIHMIRQTMRREMPRAMRRLRQTDKGKS